jgi:hypothetical protein
MVDPIVAGKCVLCSLKKRAAAARPAERVAEFVEKHAAELRAAPELWMPSNYMETLSRNPAATRLAEGMTGGLSEHFSGLPEGHGQ